MNINYENQDVIISIANSEDLEKILELQKIAFLNEAALINDYTIPPLKQTINEIRDEFRYSSFLKAIKENQIIGSVRAALQEETCQINKLIVDPKYQNRGIGSLLLKKIENKFSDIKRFELFTGKKSKGNHTFYIHRGYIPFKEVKINEKLTLVYYEKFKLNQ